MDAAAFVLVAIGVSVLGSLVLVLRQRKPALGVEDSVDSFRREMEALSPPAERRSR